MTDFEKRLGDLRSQNEDLKSRKIRFETTLQERTRNRDKTVAALKELDVTPETLDETINLTQEHLESLLSEGETVQAEAQAVFDTNQAQLDKLED